MTSTLDGGRLTGTSQGQRRPAVARSQAPTRGSAAVRPTSIRGRRLAAEVRRRPSAGELAQRVPFVVVILLLIGAGVGGTLWFSAQSTQDTYRLKNAREVNVRLVERKEALQVQNERARSAEVLAARAADLGMVSVEAAPILVRGAEGEIEVVGAPQAKLGVPIQPLQSAPVPSAPAGSRTNGGRDSLSARSNQSQGVGGVSALPYSPVVPPPGGIAPPPVPQPAVNVPLAPVVASPVPVPAAGPQLDPATLAPVPGQQH